MKTKSRIHYEPRAADIITNGSCSDFTKLTEEQKEQVEFVQFHPNYDYSDFVEGLRPFNKKDGTIGFDLKEGNIYLEKYGLIIPVDVDNYDDFKIRMKNSENQLREHLTGSGNADPFV